MSRKNYAQLVQLLKTRGFVDLHPVDRNGHCHYLATYGAPGTFLRQNIMRQWWNLMVVQQTNVFPVEGPMCILNTTAATSEARLQTQEFSVRENLDQDCVCKYLHVLKLTNSRLPVSIVATGQCLSWKHVSEQEPEEKRLLLGMSNQTKLVLQNYTAPAGISVVFDYWLQLRLSWWKKYAKNPAKFTLKSSSQNDENHIVNHSNSKTHNGDLTKVENNIIVEEASPHAQGIKPSRQSQITCITYQFPWGPEVVEEVSNKGEKHLAYLESRSDKNYKGKTIGNKSCLPHCIECSTSLEAAAAVWLVDSFHIDQQHCSVRKKYDTNKEKSKPNLVLQLHHQIAPYQVSIVIDSSPGQPQSSTTSSSTSVEMSHICDKLERDLQKADVQVFNTCRHGSTLEAHLKRNDQLGVPYTVIVSEVTLKDGVVRVRNRDTAIQMDNHISCIVEDISRNLKAQLEVHA